jgi:hypothetical protein
MVFRKRLKMRGKSEARKFCEIVVDSSGGVAHITAIAGRRRLGAMARP